MSEDADRRFEISVTNTTYYPFQFIYDQTKLSLREDGKWILQHGSGLAVEMNDDSEIVRMIERVGAGMTINYKKGKL